MSFDGWLPSDELQLTTPQQPQHAGHGFADVGPWSLQALPSARQDQEVNGEWERLAERLGRRLLGWEELGDGERVTAWIH